MISRELLLAVSLVVVSPSLLRAQSAPGGTGPSAADLTNYDKMYEDVEILRCILDRKLHPLYPRNTHPSMGGMMGLQGGRMGWDPNMGGTGYSMSGYSMGGGGTGYSMGGYSMGGMSGMMGIGGGAPNNTVWIQDIGHSLEGVYLKGQGVVYTATLSSLQTSAKAETARQPVSEWESVRRKLHNEKEEAKKPDANKPSALSDVLLKVLAENGHHFSQLGENESLTLVITVHDTNLRPTALDTGVPVKAGSQPPVGGSTVSSKVRDLELLGDLHMKQEHYGMARDAFRKAVELKPGRKQTAVLARKLAQAYLMLDNIEEARWALDQSLALMKENANAKDKPTTAPKPATVALPIKLIISAPKKLLDEAGKGKITAEEFRRKASVETMKFEDRPRRK